MENKPDMGMEPEKEGVQGREKNRDLELIGLWKDRLRKAADAWDEQADDFSRRENLYRGKQPLKPVVEGDLRKTGENWKAGYCYNLVFENIEAQVSPSIPAPKITAVHREDQELAHKMEQWLANEMDRIPAEEKNDLAERVAPLQGGVGWLVEWDDGQKKHGRTGENVLSVIHPKMWAPQPGVYTDPEDMDYFILRLPQTRGFIMRRYGVWIRDPSEEEPGLRSDEPETAEDMVTCYTGYWRGEDGGIGKIVWCRDTVLEYSDNYQARYVERCENCGTLSPEEGSGGKCPKCGGSFRRVREEYQELPEQIRMPDGRTIGGMTEVRDESGVPSMGPVRVPYYVPNQYPIVIQKTVSLYDQLLGNSDADVIEDQQNAVSRLDLKALTKVLRSGTKVALPEDPGVDLSPEEQEVWRFRQKEKIGFIKTFDFSGDVGTSVTMRQNVYKDSQNLLGITDSYLGRVDPTAASGKAKQFSAAQAAGRFASKKVMKEAAWAKIYERMFRNFLAYGDEPRAVRDRDSQGNIVYTEISRFEFLRQDPDTGEWYWNDDFLFSTDSSTAMERNREAMWEQTRNNYQSGVFGDVQTDEARAKFWEIMERHHYPGAGEMKAYFEDRLNRQKAMQAMESLRAAGPQAAPAAGTGAGLGATGSGQVTGG